MKKRYCFDANGKPAEPTRFVGKTPIEDVYADVIQDGGKFQVVAGGALLKRSPREVGEDEWQYEERQGNPVVIIKQRMFEPPLEDVHEALIKYMDEVGQSHG